MKEGREERREENTNLEWKLLQQLSPEVEQTEVEQVVGFLTELPPATELAPDLPLGLGLRLLFLPDLLCVPFKQTTDCCHSV